MACQRTDPDKVAVAVAVADRSALYFDRIPPDVGVVVACHNSCVSPLLGAVTFMQPLRPLTFPEIRSLPGILWFPPSPSLRWSGGNDQEFRIEA